MKVLVATLAAIVLALGSGCTSITVARAPKVDLTQFKRIFVLQPFNENHHVDELIVDELKREGRNASSGPMTMLPDNADAVMIYEASWTGDFTTNLVDLHLHLYTAHTNKRLAEGRYYQPSARPKPAEAVIGKLVPQLFGK